MKDPYLSMWEASKLCPYGQEYLSLLARRKLLKAVKIGKKWFTTREWLTEYVQEKKPGTMLAAESTSTVSQKRFFIGLKNPALSFTLATFVVFFLIVAVAYNNISEKITTLEERSGHMAQISPAASLETSYPPFFTAEELQQGLRY